MRYKGTPATFRFVPTLQLHYQVHSFGYIINIHRIINSFVEVLLGQPGRIFVVRDASLVPKPSAADER